MNEDLEQSQVEEAKVESTTTENENTTQENEAVEAIEKQVPQSRVNKITWEKHQAIRERDELQKKLDGFQTPSPSQIQEVVSPLVAPTIEAYDYDEVKFSEANKVYEKAEVANLVDQKFKKMKEDDRVAAIEAASREVLNEFERKAAEYATNNPSYNEAIQASGNIQFSQSISEVVLASKNQPALHHYLLNNPQEVDRLSNMSPLQVAMYLGSVEASLGKKEVVQSNAPEPFETVQGTSTASSDNYTHLKGAKFE